ncbi:MAG: hypothetical protein IPI57_12810 [Candidatus Competibacteraceae bacterium]|nr:hypothetical protein [Candidatus Competibacteraceae bacterium]
MDGSVIGADLDIDAEAIIEDQAADALLVEGDVQAHLVAQFGQNIANVHRGIPRRLLWGS